MGGPYSIHPLHAGGHFIYDPSISLLFSSFFSSGAAAADEEAAWLDLAGATYSQGIGGCVTLGVVAHLSPME